MTKTEDSLLIPTPSEDLMPKFPYLEKVIRASRIVNMWPKTGKSNALLYHSVVFFVILSCLSLILLFVIQIQNEYQNLESVASLISTVLDTTSATFRYIYVYVKGSKYPLLASQIHNKFVHYSIFPKENRASIVKYYKLANNMFIVYCGFNLLWVIQFCTVPLFTYIWDVSNLSKGPNETETEKIEYPVPMKVYVPFDYDKQPANAIFYLYQCISISIVGWVYVVVDCFWYMVFVLTIGQFALLKDSIDTIVEILEKDGPTEEGFKFLKENESKELEEGLKHCVKRHQFMREFVLQLDDVSSPNMFVDTLLAVVSMGFVLLETTISLRIRDWSRVQGSLTYISSLSFHVFLYNFLGNEVTSKEEELREAVYRIPWYKCPKIKPFVMLMAAQSGRPSKLTGGRMFKLGLQFYTSMMQAAFSYFTFFLQFINKRKVD